MPDNTHSPGGVFLSYAREDTNAAKRIAEAMRAFGVDAWFDQSELRGGDAWDAKIKKQIRECALFMPIISATTQARGEGYFRREWKMAVERTHDMAASRTFIVPVVIDHTPEAGAEAPEEFMRVQWTRLQHGAPTPEFIAQIKRLLDTPRKPSLKPDLPRPPTLPPEFKQAARKAEDQGQKKEVSGTGRKSGLPGWVWAVAAVALLAVGAGVVFLRQPAAPVATAEKSLPPPAASLPPPTAPVAADKSIAVLPFVNMGGDKDSEYFSDGLTEEILNALARNPALRVASRTSSFAFKGKTIPMDEIGRALRAASVIEGSVRKSGSSVRITVQLINAADGYHVWSETFTRELTDIFAVQDEIAAKIAQKLGGGPAAPAVAGEAVPTKNLAAYDAFLRGRAAMTSGWSESSSAETVRLFEQAVRLDPDYALAWARLAQALVRIWSDGYDRNPSLAARAREAAATALRLAPDLPEAHRAQAGVAGSIDGNIEAASRELDMVERLRPNDPELPASRAHNERVRGRPGERLAALALRAAEADPQNADTLVQMASYLGACGRYAEAVAFCDRAWSISQVAENPIRVKSSIFSAWTGDVGATLALLETLPETLRMPRFFVRRASLRALQGDITGARADFEHLRALVADRYADRSGPRGTAVSALLSLARLDAGEGQEARARQRNAEALVEADRYLRDFPNQPDTGYELRAKALAQLGRQTEAMAALDELVRVGSLPDDSTQTDSLRQARAETFAILGDADRAVAELLAMQADGKVFGYTLRLNSHFVSLRANAKFQQLMKECEARADAVPRPKK
jgi:TolB-like protein/tetratricopeptide (TPR) repeat protein